MVSRDTQVHLVAVIVAMVLGYAASVFVGVGGLESASFALLLVFYGIAFGGAHFYLAIKGEGGMVPPDARWRYVAMLAIVLTTAGVVLYAGDRTIGSVTLTRLGQGLILVVIVGYLVVETIESYRDTRPE